MTTPEAVNGKCRLPGSPGPIGQTFDAVTYGDHVGEFWQINGQDIGNRHVLQSEYLETVLQFTLTSEP